MKNIKFVLFVIFALALAVGVFIFLSSDWKGSRKVLKLEIESDCNDGENFGMSIVDICGTHFLFYEDGRMVIENGSAVCGTFCEVKEFAKGMRSKCSGFIENFTDGRYSHDEVKVRSVDRIIGDASNRYYMQVDSVNVGDFIIGGSDCYIFEVHSVNKNIVSVDRLDVVNNFNKINPFSAILLSGGSVDGASVKDRWNKMRENYILNLQN
jgi:hypothetical protein